MHVRAPSVIPVILSACALAAAGVGIFEGHDDVGVTPKKGSVEFAGGEYRVTGGGANMWGAADAFQFVWKRLSGDVSIVADVRFIGAGKVPHRKAVLIVRQNLDPDSVYADAALHGSGLTCLQYRATAGAITQQVQSPLEGPARIRLDRRGNQFTLYAGKAGEELQPAGPVTVTLQDPVYVGIGVCSHDAETLETAIFSNVRIGTRP